MQSCTNAGATKHERAREWTCMQGVFTKMEQEIEDCGRVKRRQDERNMGSDGAREVLELRC